MLYKRLEKIDVFIFLSLTSIFFIKGGSDFLSGISHSLLSYLNVLPYVILGVGFSSWAVVSRLEVLVGGIFRKREFLAILGGSCVGALTPLCSLLVITFVTGLLRAGVPLSAVMAFWISSPLMSPSAFFLTRGILGTEIAFIRLACALAMGVISGLICFFPGKIFRVDSNPLGEGKKSRYDLSSRFHAFFDANQSEFKANLFLSKERRIQFFKKMGQDLVFFTKWLLFLFFLIDCLNSTVDMRGLVHGLAERHHNMAIPVSAFLGTLIYLNGVAAVPLAQFLLKEGLSLAAVITFMMAGAATSLPAMSAVFPIVKFRVFLTYLFCAFFGSLAIGYFLQLVN